ncbi:redox-regulated ATPase YchF [Candidatus Roizmanbacteria bacterium]|nr:redox-regulated ATPase YchF [Candidatus Roizmanbacteria bacterium]
MKLSIGIVGLPNVGKSTLFNALLKKQIANVANYPFCTIEPNVGIIEVPDERLPVLAKIVNTTKIVPAVVEFYDIAGLVRGASKGEGLGNKFLSHIREVEAIVHVVRLFEDSNVVHVSDKINPADDIKTIETELILADLETLNKQKETYTTYAVVRKVKEQLDKGIPVRQQTLNEEELAALKQLNLLTLKPIIYVFNVSENQLQNQEETEKKIEDVLKQVQNNKSGYLYLCAKMEAEIVVFNEIEQREYLKQFGLEESGLNRLIKKSYKTLGLISFLTAGTLEARAWTIKKGTLAPQAAGVIHTDFEKKFIKADVVPYPKFIEVGGWVAAREQGLVQTVGRDYEMKEDEVVEFKIGA